MPGQREAKERRDAKLQKYNCMEILRTEHCKQTG